MDISILVLHLGMYFYQYELGLYSYWSHIGDIFLSVPNSGFIHISLVLGMHSYHSWIVYVFIFVSYQGCILLGPELRMYLYYSQVRDVLLLVIKGYEFMLVRIGMYFYESHMGIFHIGSLDNGCIRITGNIITRKLLIMSKYLIAGITMFILSSWYDIILISCYIWTYTCYSLSYL